MEEKILVVASVDTEINWGVDVALYALGIFDSVKSADEMVSKKFPESKADLNVMDYRYTLERLDKDGVPEHISISFKPIELNTSIDVYIGGGYYQE